MRLNDSYQHIMTMRENKTDDTPLFKDVFDEEFIPLKIMFKESPALRGLPIAKLLDVSKFI